MENIEFKELCIKNCMSFYFDGIIKLEDFDIVDNILIDEKSSENILIYYISDKTLIRKRLHIRFDKIDGIRI